MPKTLSAWLTDIEGLHRQTIELGLARVKTVATRLAVLHFPCPIFMVGGTNGKGSCVAFLEAILSKAGYYVGAYTSPHLIRFHERIRLSGSEVTDSQLIQAFEQVEQARGVVALTFFEFTTLAALVVFSKQCVETLEKRLDAIILEVGLGGRLDAVNIVEPDVSIVTSISLDHMDWLGKTRAQIGYEKAGIFRKNKPAICGEPNPPQRLLETAKNIGSELYCVNQHFSFKLEPYSAQKEQSWHWETVEKQFPSLEKTLNRPHQRNLNHLPIPKLPLQNAATALMALTCLQSRFPKVDAMAISTGLQTAFIPGRYQITQENPQVILDVAHNPGAAIYLAEQLRKQKTSGKTIAVVGMLSDKDIFETLRPLLPMMHTWYIASLDVPRGENSKILAYYLDKLGVNADDVHPNDTILSAFRQALQSATPHDRIVVFGSFHAVGPVLENMPLLLEGTCF